jgi:multicomponent Na+:H+ antiporter subunit G
MIDLILNYIAGILILVGALFTLTASIGLLRLPDLYTRMHAASKAGTLGSCVVLLALALQSNDAAIALRALAGILFFLLTVPISSHLLAKAAHGAGYDLWEHSKRDDLTIAEEKARRAKPAAGTKTPDN